MRLNEVQSIGTIWKMYRLYLEAFPISERKPFSRILKKRKNGGTEMLTIESDEGKFLGLAFTICYKDRVLLDYFAIRKDKRAGGAGTEALRLLIERYKEYRLVLEIETTRNCMESRDECFRRKAFYLRNGMTELDFEVVLFGVEMEMLGNGCEMTFEEYQEIYSGEYGSFILPNIKQLQR